MATKIQINSKKYCTFGGIFYVQDVFNRTLSDVIDNFLGLRGSTPRAYRYSELMSALFCNYLCGGDVLEDLNTRFRSEIGRPDGRVPSADVVGDSLRSLAVENVTHTSKTGREFHFNFAKRMNQLLLKCLLATGQLKKGMTIDVDFDHVFLPCEKKDATFSYKQKYGYFPEAQKMISRHSWNSFLKKWGLILRITRQTPIYRQLTNRINQIPIFIGQQ